ncbi:hypothetical protein P7L78_04490 (plasmid) [Tistrella bauzanensis]|uniref:Uncharacterized protein n=1 Tax=Tistrella arctica TaxID=3133430 RepID=A0ABU9YNZ7_9PROT
MNDIRNDEVDRDERAAWSPPVLTKVAVDEVVQALPIGGLFNVAY